MTFAFLQSSGASSNQHDFSKVIRGLLGPVSEDHSWGVINSQLTLIFFSACFSSCIVIDTRVSMGPGKIHCRVLKELPGLIARTLSTITMALGVWRDPSQMVAAKYSFSFQEGIV